MQSSLLLVRVCINTGATLAITLAINKRLGTLQVAIIASVYQSSPSVGVKRIQISITGDNGTQSRILVIIVIAENGSVHRGHAGDALTHVDVVAAVD